MKAIRAAVSALLLLGLAITPALAQERVLRMGERPAAAPAMPEQRVALVIGNGQYKDGPLLNPVNDARAIAQALGRSGFHVVEKENVGRAEMQVVLREFGDALQKGGVGLFYFAGHGVQVKGRNFLIPVDANIEREDEVAYNSVDANQVLDKMEAANNRLNIVILDACRNNPFARSARSAAAGLAQMDAPVGTFIAFATSPGSVASDGQGKNGLYTQHLLKAMLRPGVKIEDVFKDVRAGVRRDSKGKQVPWESTSLEGDFVFVPKPPARPAASIAPGPEKPIERIGAPALHVGDSWTYQVIDLLSGSVTKKYTVKLTATTANEWRFGKDYVTDKSWNLLRETKDGKLVQKWTPKRPNYDFPMQIGRTWQLSAVRDSPDRQVEHAYTFRVIRQERIVVPAGIFDTLRVEGTNKYKGRRKDGTPLEGFGVHRYWYSPAVARFVAYEYEETSSKGVVIRKDRDELVSYTRAAKEAPRP
ncbi:MAG TPA: caspase family protein [Burkholderiales bacterium]|nr:caspase family protein [Burkholderiales bacterium]